MARLNPDDEAHALASEIALTLDMTARLLVAGMPSPRLRREPGDSPRRRDRVAIRRVLTELVSVRSSMAASVAELEVLELRHDQRALDIEDTKSWRSRFVDAQSPRDLLNVAKAFGLSDRQLLTTLPGLSSRTLRRWRATDATSPSDERREQLDDFRAIMGLLLARGTNDNEAIIAWLNKRHESLEMSRPLAALGEGRFYDVVVAAEQFVSPRRSVAAVLEDIAAPEPTQTNDQSPDVEAADVA